MSGCCWVSKVIKHTIIKLKSDSCPAGAAVSGHRCSRSGGGTQGGGAAGAAAAGGPWMMIILILITIIIIIIIRRSGINPIPPTVIDRD